MRLSFFSRSLHKMSECLYPRWISSATKEECQIIQNKRLHRLKQVRWGSRAVKTMYCYSIVLFMNGFNSHPCHRSASSKLENCDTPAVHCGDVMVVKWLQKVDPSNILQAFWCNKFRYNFLTQIRSHSLCRQFIAHTETCGFMTCTQYLHLFTYTCFFSVDLCNISQLSVCFFSSSPLLNHYWIIRAMASCLDACCVGQSACTYIKANVSTHLCVWKGPGTFHKSSLKANYYQVVPAIRKLKVKLSCDIWGLRYTTDVHSHTLQAGRRR